MPAQSTRDLSPQQLAFIRRKKLQFMAVAQLLLGLAIESSLIAQLCICIFQTPSCPEAATFLGVLTVYVFPAVLSGVLGIEAFCRNRKGLIMAHFISNVIAAVTDFTLFLLALYETWVLMSIASIPGISTGPLGAQRTIAGIQIFIFPMHMRLAIDSAALVRECWLKVMDITEIDPQGQVADRIQTEKEITDPRCKV